MQDGFIFSDSIERNTATEEETMDQEKLINAVHIARIKGFCRKFTAWL